jgi:hypothetical protein
MPKPLPKEGAWVFLWGRWFTCWLLGHDEVTEPTPVRGAPLWCDTYCRRCLKTPLWGGWVETNVRGFR